MKVKELIEALSKMPQEADVWHLWDGELRTQINIVYETKEGEVATADYGEVCYSTESRPKDAPTREEDMYWETAPNPIEEIEL